MKSQQQQFGFRLRRGLLFQLWSQFLSKFTGFICNIFLARLLLPEDFGVYGIAMFILVCAATLGGNGLSAALLQREETPDKSEIDRVYTLQIFISLILLALGWALAPLLAGYYSEKAITPQYIRIFLFALVFMKVRLIPQVMWERELKYDLIAKVDLLESFLFQSTSLFLAWRGFGPWSFLWGMVLSRLVGFMAAMSLAQSKPQFSFNLAGVGELFKFGMYFQLGGVFNLMRDAVTPIFIGKALGVAATGYIFWASSLSGLPLFIISALDKMGFAAFSRLQSSPDAFRRVFYSWVRINCIVVLGITGAFLPHVGPIIRIIFTEKWLPAEPLVYCYSINFAFYAAGNISTMATNALGKSKVTFYQSVFWFIYFAVASVFLVDKFGLTGYGFVVLGSSFVQVIIYIYVGRLVGVNILRAFLKPFCLALASGVLGYFLYNEVLASGFWSLCTSIVLSLISYGLGVFLFFKRELGSFYREQTMNLESFDEHQIGSAYRPIQECPLCKSKDIRWIRQEKNDFPAASPLALYNKKPVKLSLCQLCEFAFVNPLPADPDFFAKLYNESEGKWGYQIQFDFSGKWLVFRHVRKSLMRYKNEGELLDVGAATGAFINSVKDLYDVNGVEASVGAAQYGRSLGLNITSSTFLEADFSGKKYDILTFIDVLEHLEGPDKILTRARELIKPQGILYIKVPNYQAQLAKQNLLRFLGISSEGIMKNFVHINHFSPTSLKIHLERNGFKVRETGFCPPEVWDLRIPGTPKERAARLAQHFGYRIITMLFNAIARITGIPCGFNFYVLAEKV